MAEYIERERAEIIFRDARLALKPEGCKDWNEYVTRDMMLMNAEQAIHIIPAADVSPRCPHYIRNIHDRGDDSLCEKWGCEVKDVQPVRHGRWMKTIGENGVTSACRCNLCGFEDNRYSLFNYCPNCGAKMEASE